MKRIAMFGAVLALVPSLAFAADTNVKGSTGASGAPAAVSTGTKADTKVDTKVDAGKKSEASKSDAVKSDSATTAEAGKKSEAQPVKTTTVAKAKTAHKAVHKAAIKAKPADSNDSSKAETPKL